MITPAFLKNGDTVAIVSTARKVQQDFIDEAVRLLTSWGLHVKLGKNLFAADHQYAGSDVQRAADLQDCLDDQSVKAVFCARGGYGTIRILDKLEFKKFKTFPKWIVGYSDVTVLHAHVQQTLGIETMHATMPVNFSKNATECLEQLRRTLFGEPLEYRLPSNVMNRHGQGKGELMGGNLSILYSLMGSPSFPDMNGKILFLEDLDEYLYHIDRMMMNLKRSGALTHLRGLIVGGMTDMRDNEVPFGKTAEEIIRDAVSSYDYPVMFGFPAGHVDDNRPLILGRKISLEVSNSGAAISF